MEVDMKRHPSIRVMAFANGLCTVLRTQAVARAVPLPETAGNAFVTWGIPRDQSCEELDQNVRRKAAKRLPSRSINPLLGLKSLSSRLAGTDFRVFCSSWICLRKGVALR